MRRSCARQWAPCPRFSKFPRHRPDLAQLRHQGVPESGRHVWHVTLGTSRPTCGECWLAHALTDLGPRLEPFWGKNVGQGRADCGKSSAARVCASAAWAAHERHRRRSGTTPDRWYKLTRSTHNLAVYVGMARYNPCCQNAPGLPSHDPETCSWVKQFTARWDPTTKCPALSGIPHPMPGLKSLDPPT